MLLSNFQRLFNTVHPAVVDGFRHLFLTLHLCFHLDGTRRPCAFQLIIQMAGCTLAGKSNILT
ncbi:Uncharacterised protein [Shigella sonnei]|nr:Uncharacterised protein [Shigella sonnei]CSG33656.1 Uncharacterised protein [Shigella sonnei]CSG34546.1 Uncharacterised protein [Shigella sonnei]